MSCVSDYRWVEVTKDSWVRVEFREGQWKNDQGRPYHLVAYVEKSRLAGIVLPWDEIWSGRALGRGGMMESVCKSSLDDARRVVENLNRISGRLLKW